MLSAEHVLCRKRKGDLLLKKFDEESLARAREIATVMLEAARSQVGGSRAELDEALDAALLSQAVSANEHKMAAGLRKLLDDLCTFETQPTGKDDQPIDPAALRATLFARAARERRLGTFDRDRLLSEAAGAAGLAPSELERALYGDLPAAHRLERAPDIGPEAFVDDWVLAQAQAVLLRAVRVTADVSCARPATARALLRTLKFHQLLFDCEPTSNGFRLQIDGPLSLFEATTRYGLKLALALPALRACDHFDLEADVRWGKAREALRFVMSGGVGKGVSVDDAGEEPPVPEELTSLVDGFRSLGSAWDVSPSTALLHAPGHGTCVPDLVFRHRAEGSVVYFELLGFWSRDAVFRRVDLVRAGLPGKVLFALSKRLRVSEAVLDDEDLPAALYVYRATMSAKAVLERLERLRVDPETQATGKLRASSKART